MTGVGIIEARLQRLTAQAAPGGAGVVILGDGERGLSESAVLIQAPGMNEPESFEILEVWFR